VILNNLANTHTIGFKRSRVMLAAKVEPSQATKPHSRHNVSAVAIGGGVELAATPLDTTDGPLKKTDQPLDVAITGPGFFQIHDDDEVLYTRCGMWTTNADGVLCLISGDELRPVEPPLTVPADAVGVTISETGIVTALRPGEVPRANIIGKIILARFQNPSGLKPRGGHLLSATAACGAPQTGSPHSQGFGLLRQGMLELSNVSRDEELEQFQMLQSQLQLLRHLTNTADAYSPPGPVAKRPATHTQRASANAVPVQTPLSLEPLKALKNKGQDLIEKYLHSLETSRSQHSERNPEEWYKRYFMSEKARSIERNLGFD
jgi:flagellar basal-body rod protein FlgG